MKNNKVGSSNSIAYSRKNTTILLIASFAPSLINFRAPLILTLLAAGNKVNVAAPNMSIDIRNQLEKIGARVWETPLERAGMNPIRDFAYFRCLRRLIKKLQPSFVLTYTIKPNIWGALAARATKARSVAMVTGLGFAFTKNENTKLKPRFINKIASRLYRHATNRNWRIIFQNPDDRDDFIAAGCLADPNKARMVHGSGVDLEHYARAPLPDSPVFLMIARLLGNKGVREYGAAVALVKQTHPHAKFLLVGYMDEGPDGIKKQELDARVQNGVEYLGPQSDVRPIIARASVYVLPSYREGTPRSVLEAMAMGRCILTSDAPGCRETVQTGETGFLIPIRNVNALAEKMRWMIDHPNARKTMGAKSYALACEKYDVHKVNKSLMRHLELL